MELNDVSVLVPYRPDGAERERNWSYLRERWQANHPDWQLVLGTCEGAWSKGLAVADAARKAEGEVFIVADADVMVGREALVEAVERLQDAPWVIPHRIVYRLTERATQALIDGRIRLGKKLPPRLGRAHLAPPGGGISAVRRDDFERVGGIDERFEGWGGEDISFARALDTLVGPHQRLDDCLWHLWHTPAKRRPRNRASEVSERLAARYLEANGDELAMRELCERAPYEGIRGGGAVVARAEAVREVPPDPRFVGWGQEDTAWAMALTALRGRPWRAATPLVHLFHPAQSERPNRGSSASRRLRIRYGRARADRQKMLALIEEAVCSQT